MGLILCAGGLIGVFGILGLKAINEKPSPDSFEPFFKKFLEESIQKSYAEQTKQVGNSEPKGFFGKLVKKGVELQSRLTSTLVSKFAKPIIVDRVIMLTATVPLDTQNSLVFVGMFNQWIYVNGDLAKEIEKESKQLALE